MRSDKRIARDELREARKDLAAVTRDMKKRGDHEEGPDYWTANERVARAEQNVPRWRR